MNRPSRRTIIEAAAGGVAVLTILGLAGAPPEIVEVPVPSPYEVVVPSPYEVIVPSPYPVADIPEECQVIIDALLDENIEFLEFIIAVYNAYLDYPDENLTDFGRRVEALMTDRTYTPNPVLEDMSPCER